MKRASYDHIVLVSLDTLRSDGIAANPAPLWPRKYAVTRPPRTPGLDALARSGAYFPHCITAAPYTSAAHGSILTGRWPVRHGAFEFFRGRVRAPTLFTRAARAGYTTVLKVDFPIILGPTLGFTNDVDHYLVEDDERFLELLAAAPRTLSCVHFGGLHIPYGFHSLRFGGEAYRAKVAELESALPRLDAIPVDRLVETYRDADDYELLVRYKRVVQHLYLEGAYDQLFALYLEGVERFLRDRFQPFLDRLVATMEGRRWLLVLFGDHGEEYDADSYGHYNTLAEGALRVPLVLWGADVPRGLHTSRVRTVDIAPTVVEMAGLAGGTGGMDGATLTPLLRGDAGAGDRTAFVQAYVPETARHVEYQRRLLERGTRPSSLRHYLLKEAVYEGGWKLTRQNYRYGPESTFGEIEPCAPVLSLERASFEELPTPAADAGVEGRLAARLDAFNRLRGSRASAVAAR
ncbi:MAG TPA: sulfatase-like hydrolase/transferase [Candidatus Dormibacteraeota bacterium]|nr:sulfatase-like hydrolase/transferase [Candidatus Dormibacteraeota bacterium]